MRIFVASSKRVVAVADVLRAAIPEITEVEDRIDNAGSVAPRDLASVDRGARGRRIGIRENGVRNRSCFFNAGDAAWRNANGRNVAATVAASFGGSR